jgi:hypothetical protein
MAIALRPDQQQRVIDLGNQTRQQYPRAFSACHVEGNP